MGLQEKRAIAVLCVSLLALMARLLYSEYNHSFHTGIHGPGYIQGEAGAPNLPAGYTCEVAPVPAQAPKWDNGLPKLLPTDNSIYSDKWAVLTTINDPTPAIRKLASIPGWKVVVVADLKTPKNWQSPNCVFLSVDDQKKLGYEIVDLLPFHAYSRKNIGYLYAIQHGAKIIYETDDDNEPTGDTLPMSPEHVSDGICFAKRGSVETTRTVNPYAYFGRVDIWPRGYPLESIFASSHKPSTEKCHARPYIQQFLADLDPDVDAIFRLTHGSDVGTVRFADKKAISLPRGVFTPYNSQNTLHLHDAFWGLIIPSTVTFRVCDIWRGYFTQRLLWDVEGNLQFGKATVEQDRNVHDYIADLMEEIKLYDQAGKLVNFLAEWKDDSPHMYDRILNLSWEMAVGGFWGAGEVDITRAWLRDLHRVGYSPPTPSRSGV